MVTLKPSLLENFRIYKKGLFNKTLEETINDIKGVRRYNPAMSAGSLIHHYLDTGETSLVVDNKTYNLYEEEIVQLSPLRVALKQCIREMKFREPLDGNIMISGRGDSVYGLIGNEVKTGKRFYGYEFYENSIQWKLYTLSLGLQVFTYIHIQILTTYQPHKFNIQDFDLYPFDGMKKEVLSECYEFIRFCEIHNLMSYING
jgi:hypothetical protein